MFTVNKFLFNIKIDERKFMNHLIVNECFIIY